MRRSRSALRKYEQKRAVEMPGLWKAWKAKGRLPPLSTSPLEISPKGGAIPHFHSSDDEGGWESGKPRVQRRLACSVGDSPIGVMVRSPVAWIAGRRDEQPTRLGI